MEGGLAPSQHLVDAGYVSAKLILNSQEHNIELIGPVHVDPSWQAHTPGAFDASRFQVNWEAQSATWPAGANYPHWVRSENLLGLFGSVAMFQSEKNRSNSGVTG